MRSNHRANLSWGYPCSYPCMFSPTVRSVCSASVVRVCSGCCTCCCTSRRRSSAGSSFASPHEDKPIIEAAAVAETKRVANLLLILLLFLVWSCIAEATLAPRPLTVAEEGPSRLRLFPLLAKGARQHQGPHHRRNPHQRLRWIQARCSRPEAPYGTYARHVKRQVPARVSGQEGRSLLLVNRSSDR